MGSPSESDAGCPIWCLKEASGQVAGLKGPACTGASRRRVRRIRVRSVDCLGTYSLSDWNEGDHDFQQ
jgi:hypothetical protein